MNKVNKWLNDLTKFKQILLIAGIWYLSMIFMVFAAPTTVKIPQGGTGFSSTSPNSILVTGNSSTSPLIATSSNPLWIGSFNATSTSATSTLNWGLTIVGGGLRIVGGTKVNNPITFSDLNCSGLSNGGTLTTDGQGTIICAADDSGGGGATPSGQDTQIQFNNGGSALGSSANLVFDYNNGLFGIASTTPFGQLSVEMGTSSYPFFVGDKGTSTPAFVVLGNSRVGIGTTTPGTLLGVHGDAAIAGLLSLNSFYATSTTATSTIRGAATAGGLLIDSGALRVTGTASSSFAGGLTISSGLHVIGGARILNPITFIDLNCSGLSNGGTLTTDSNGTVVCQADDSGAGATNPSGANGELQFNNSNAFGSSANLFFNQTNGLLGIGGTSTPTGQLTIEMGTSTFPVWIGDQAAGSTTPTFVVRGDNRIGLGTSTPGALLSVQGGAIISGTTSVHALHATSTIQLGTSSTANFLSGLATSTLANGLNLTGGGLRVTGGTQLSNAVQITGTLNCNGASVLETDNNGVIQCGADASGGTASAVGADGHLQFSTSGSLNASANVFFNNTYGFFGLGGTTTPSTIVAEIPQFAIEMGTSTYPFWIGDFGSSTPTLVVRGNSRVGVGTTTPDGTLSVQGTLLTSGQASFAVATGTAPFLVYSGTKVANLNADLLDGMDSSAFGDATAANQTTIITRIGTNTDATSTPSGAVSLFAGLKGLASTTAVIDIQRFTASGTWKMPPGWTTAYVKVEMVGGGGGGGGGGGTAAASATAGGGGGGGGSGESKIWTGFTASSTIVATIGAGGTGGAGGSAGANSGSNGGVGGSTSFDSIVTALGGNGGVRGIGGASNTAQGSGGNGAQLTADPDLRAINFYASANGISGSGGQGGRTSTTGSGGINGASAIFISAIGSYASSTRIDTIPSGGAAGGVGGSSLWGAGGVNGDSVAMVNGGTTGNAGSAPSAGSYGAGGGGGSGAASDTPSPVAAAGGAGGAGLAGYMSVTAFKIN